MSTNRESRSSALQALPPLTAATTIMFACASLLLMAGAVMWEPGKNPRWVIVSMAGVCLVFTIWALVRASRFTRAEALFMAGAQLTGIGALTWMTDLALGALANGTVLPIVGVYVTWFLHPVAGRVVLLLGSAWWFVAIVHHDGSGLTPFAVSLLVQTIVATEALSRVKWHMDKVARTDPLTGILNRLGMSEALERELRRAAKRNEDLCVVAVDLDGLRAINNTRGHTAGDQLLTDSSRHWSEQMRRGDVIGRIGGDEFLFVFPSTSESEAVAIVQRLADTSPGAWSAGIATAEPGESAQSVLERADRRMYVQKAARQSV